MILLVILSYWGLFHLKLLLSIVNYFTPYYFLAILNNFKQFRYMVMVVILLVDIGYYFIEIIGGY
jgi:hypothetical protein